MSRCLAREEAKNNIRVNRKPDTAASLCLLSLLPVVCPGPIDTPLFRNGCALSQTATADDINAKLNELNILDAILLRKLGRQSYIHPLSDCFSLHCRARRCSTSDHLHARTERRIHDTFNGRNGWRLDLMLFDSCAISFHSNVQPTQNPTFRDTNNTHQKRVGVLTSL